MGIRHLPLLLLLLSLSGCSSVAVQKEYGLPTEVYFSPAQTLQGYLSAIGSAKRSIHCAFYELTQPRIVALLEDKASAIEVQVLVDEHKATSFPARIDNRYTTMHDKFCIIDKITVITGSANPTENDVSKNNNNLVVMHSRMVAGFYEHEFRQLWNGTQGDRKLPNAPKAYHMNGESYEILFCPQDFCADRVAREIMGAQKSVHFLSFSLTNTQIAEALIKRSAEGIDVQGILERGAVTLFSYLNASGVDVAYDENKAKMHHKVFIIDGCVVLTGSFNPTKNGDVHNDENLVIIQSCTIGKKFEAEFERLRE